MTGEFVSRQLSFLPEDMIEDAMQERKRMPATAVRLLRIAACLAVVAGLLLGIGNWDPGVVTGPGILAVTVYAEDETGIIEVPLKEGIMVDEQPIPGWTNYYTGYPAFLEVETEGFPLEKVYFKINGTAGGYNSAGHFSDSMNFNDWHSAVTCENSRWLFWYHRGKIDGKMNPVDFDDETLDQVYTNIIIYCENNIIGYAVLRHDRVYSDEWCSMHPALAPQYEGQGNVPVDVYRCTLVKSVSFPKVNGEYQDITEEYIQQCFREAR